MQGDTLIHWDPTKRSIKNQNLTWSLIYGVGHYPEREESLEFLLARRVGDPGFFAVPFLEAIWGRMTIDYTHKVMEGARCLTQLGRKSDGAKELKRLARHSDGRKYPHTFSMESIKGYRRRYVLPKIDLETGRAEYRGSLPEALASCVFQNQPLKTGTDVESTHKVKGKAKNIRD